MSQKEDRPEPHELLNLYIDYYLGDQKRRNDELEVRFGTNPYHSLTKIDFDNVCSRLKSLKFNCVNPNGNYYLRIQNNYMNNQGKEIL